MQNAKEIFEGRWNGRPYEVVKKGKTRAYRINTPPDKWPTRFGRPPGMHVRYDHVTVDGQPAPGLIAVVVLWVLNNYDALRRAGTGVYLYIPKLQTPQEALVVEKLLARMEGLIGVPAGTFKIKVLYEEGDRGPFPGSHRLGVATPSAGHERRPLGLPGKSDRDLEGRSRGRVSGSADDRHGLSQHDRLSALQRAADADGRHEERRAQHGGPDRRHGGGDDLSGRRSVRPLAIQPARAAGDGGRQVAGTAPGPDVRAGAAACAPASSLRWTTFLRGRVKARLYDAYRQSWVASPEPAYVAAGNTPLRTPLAQLQSLLDAPLETVDVNGKPVPTVASGLSDASGSCCNPAGC